MRLIITLTSQTLNVPFELGTRVEFRAEDTDAIDNNIQ